jgi:DNA primase
MVNAVLLGAISSVLGKGKETSGNNYAFECPFCHHKKPKLEVNLVPNSKGENLWHCWTCNAKGKTLVGLFKKIKASSEKISEIKSILGFTEKKEEDDSTIIKVELPKEYKPLINLSRTDIIAKHALQYLKKRGITKDDIQKYNIGYCEEGRYKNMIIIPSYDKDGVINYFIGRSFDKEPQRKYDSPKCNKNAIIGLEYFINWNVPVILCEGIFDAIAIKRNVVPLFGKTIPKALMLKLVEPCVKTVYIALDNDALREAMDYAEELLNVGKDVYLVELNDKDPSEMGFENFTKLLHSAQPLTALELLYKKIESI